MDRSGLGPRRLRNSCDFCTMSKLKCSREKPVCRRCRQRGYPQDCHYSIARRPGRRCQTSVSSDVDRSFCPGSNTREIETRLETAPLSPPSTYLDSSLSGEELQDDILNTSQRGTPKGGGYNTMGTRSSRTRSMEPVTTTPVEVYEDGSTTIESFDALLSWELSQTDVRFDSIRDGLVSLPQVWGPVSGHDTLKNMDSGIENDNRESRKAPSPIPSLSPRRQCWDDQPFLLPTSNFAENFNTSSAMAHDFVFRPSTDKRCKCSSQIGQLMYLVSLHRTASVPLDVVFTVEQHLYWTKSTTSTCEDCDPSSPYTNMIFCISIGWVLEHLEPYTGGNTAVIANNVSHPSLTIGGLELSNDVSRACCMALFKLRLRRIIKIVRGLTVSNSSTKNTISDMTRSAAAEMGATAQRMFGMVDMGGAW